jgi:hypothetical protein
MVARLEVFLTIEFVCFHYFSLKTFSSWTFLQGGGKWVKRAIIK